MSSKRSDPKSTQMRTQEPPADQQPEEPVRPMAVHPPSLEEQVEALMIRVAELERMQAPFFRLYRQHNGGHDPYTVGGSTD